MIASSRAAAITAFAIALSLHAAGFASRASEEEIQIEGGAPNAAAAFGSSFADMVAGAATPVTSKEVTETEKSEPVEPVAPKRTELQETTESIEPTQPATAATPKPVEADNPTPPLRPATEVETATKAINTAPKDPTVTSDSRETPPELSETSKPDATHLVPVAAKLLPALTPQSPAPSVTQPVPTAQPKQTETLQQVQPSASEHVRIAALPERLEATVEPGASRQMPRPITRPDPLGAKPEPTRPNPEGQPEPDQAKTPPPKVQPRSSAGNSDRNAKRGSETGAAQTKNAASSGSSTPSQAAGNAAVSNYKGTVFRRIARAKPRGVDVKGSALVSLTINGNGQLGAVRVTKSSGSTRLDEIAVGQVRRAAPFPPTPNGNSMTFSVRIKGGG